MEGVTVAGSSGGGVATLGRGIKLPATADTQASPMFSRVVCAEGVRWGANEARTIEVRPETNRPMIDQPATRSECDVGMSGLQKGDMMAKDMHELKTWPEYFDAINENRKTFEIRKADRDFKVGDVLMLQEYDPEKQRYTGQWLDVTITYVLEGGKFGIEEGYCALGFK